MSEFKGTPGPWVWGAKYVAKQIMTTVMKVNEYDDEYLAQESKYEHLAQCMPEDFDTPQWMANARLMAAAPELLEALQMAMEIGDQCSRGFLAAFQEKASAAIAKATGD